MSTDMVTTTTYRRADGELISGNYTTVGDLDYFDRDETGDYCEVIEETWVRTSARTVLVGTTDRWCAHCDEDLSLPEPAPGDPFCGDCAAACVALLTGTDNGGTGEATNG